MGEILVYDTEKGGRAMVYVRKLILPGEGAELRVIMDEKRTCFHTFYPFSIFPQKHLSEVEFAPITLFYGGNGSGKSTLINVMAGKMNAVRYSDFNRAPFFDRFVQMCSLQTERVPPNCYVLTSDDVFDYALRARAVGDRLNARRNALFDQYVQTHRRARVDPEIARMRGLDSYDQWKETVDILSPRRSQSSFIKDRVARDIDLRSNGETAMAYFLERIDQDALYFLDEPENSLSVEFQLQLADYIFYTARATRSQFIIATHSPIFLAMEGARVYDLDADPAAVCRWTELPNVRRFFEFFKSHREQFQEGGWE